MLSLSSIAFLLVSLGDKGLFNSANILQKANVVRRVVFLLFLLCFWPIVPLFLPRETNETFRHFIRTTKTTQPRAQVFSVNCPVFWQLCCRIDVIFHKWQTSSKFGQQLLVMMNYPWDFSQSEKEKYFGWTINSYWIQLSYEVKNYADLGGFCLPLPSTSVDKILLICIILYIILSLIPIRVIVMITLMGMITLISVTLCSCKVGL